MKRCKTLIQILLIPCLLFVLAGCKGPIGASGGDGYTIPSGTASMNSSLASGTENLIIVFDDDNLIDEGDEYRINIDLAPYYSGGSVVHTISWEAVGLTPGSYYMYAWVDTNNNDQLDSGTGESVTMYIFDETTLADYVFSEAPNRITSSTGILEPNYTFWNNYAYSIDFSINF